MLVPSSHKAYKELSEAFLSDSGAIDYGRIVEVSHPHLILTSPNSHPILTQSAPNPHPILSQEKPEVFSGAMVAHLEPGDVILWDDRTIHCNAPVDSQAFCLKYWN